jgi:hypothetical protein
MRRSLLTLTPLERRFVKACRYLRDWHADAVKARDYNAVSSGSGKPGSRIHRVQRWPGCRRVIEAWNYAFDDVMREQLVELVEAEVHATYQRPAVKAERGFSGKTFAYEEPIHQRLAARSR